MMQGTARDVSCIRRGRVRVIEQRAEAAASYVQLACVRAG